jgi:hypothetical protein
MKSKAATLSKYFLLTSAMACGFGLNSCGKPEPSSEATVQATFATPAEAGSALLAAARANDEKALARILGPDSKAILSSGDPAEDKAALDSFVAKCDKLNRWVAMTDGTQILNIGADNYPYPIPLAKDSSSRWYFNTKAGQDEILARQIGRNELLAIDACNSIANAEELYFRSAHDGNAAHQYTSVIMSDPGKQNGLHWHAPDDQESSPVGRLSNFPKGSVPSTEPSDAPVFDGYFLRILTAQGDKAKGGAKSYIVNGKLTGGFAVIATPVKYGDSGIKTFVISREGVVYEKDLGTSTAETAAAIKAYNPTDGWEPAE